ncbi:glycosyltransferase family 1 protein [uncultured Flavobacterium sp.]|uniref:glycosyltransferase family 4 protein n=1 Tax=uncultured Flavobacterium sp. TaxID=165435 RepID=UPI0030C7C878
MILGIDASNIRAGGGLTHLKHLLLSADIANSGFEKIIVWSNNETLSKLPNDKWLIKSTHSYLNKGFIWSFMFQIFILSKKAKKENCDVVFAPGSTFLSGFRPFVTLSQNMLPFEINEASRFPNFKDKLRFKILYKLQSYTFRQANGLIFLTNYAKNFITQKINLSNLNVAIIPHGISTDFLNFPKPQKDITGYTLDKPFKLLYVSIVTVYKHQWNVAEAVLKLRNEGYPIHLDLIGPSTPESFYKLNEVIKGNEDYISYLGSVSHDKISEYYKEADAFVFASTCENMPIILIEAMTAGLPIASSQKQPMPEVLEKGGLYFDALNVESIYICLKELLDNKTIREQISDIAYQKTKDYTWNNCSNSTFQFIKNTANTYKNNHA